MKKTFFIVLAAAVTTFSAAAKELKVLTIGNSFADSVFSFTTELANTFPDCKLILDRANLGGCSLEKHWNLHIKAEKNANFKPYYIYGDKSIPHYTLRSKLTERKWDIVTIQQVSRGSWDYNTFQPYADNLIKLIRELAPQAEIVVHQTWSYRADAPEFKPGHKWGFGQQEMYNRLDDAYSKLAEKHNLRVIPTGLAVQIYREKTPVKFKICTKEEFKNFKYPALPDQSGEVVGVTRWQINKKDKTRYIRADYKHFNNKGRYMQACLWFAFLFDKKCSDIKYVPKSLKDIDAAEIERLKQSAQQALDTFKQVKKAK